MRSRMWQLINEGKRRPCSRQYWGLLFRFPLPAQTVDATPFNAFIRQCFPGRTHLFGCTRAKPSQRSVPADLTLASDFSLCFQCKMGSS